MKALSLYQPWATLMALDEKRIETRSWPTSYRGPLAIAATKSFPREARDVFNGHDAFTEVLQPAFPNAFEWRPPSCWPQTGRWVLVNPNALPLGCVVAVVELYECLSTDVFDDSLGLLDACAPHEFDFGNFSVCRYAWLTKNCRPLPTPIPWRGSQGLWSVPLDLLAQIERQIGNVLPAHPPRAAATTGGRR